MLILFPLVVAMTPLALWITFNAHILYLVKLRVHCVLQRVRVVFMCLFCSQKWAVQRLALRGSYLKALGMCFQADCISRCLMFPCPGSLSPSPSFPFHSTNVDIAFSFGSTKTLGHIHFCPTCSSLSEKVYRAWSTLGRIPKNNIIIIKKNDCTEGLSVSLSCCFSCKVKTWEVVIYLSHGAPCAVTHVLYQPWHHLCKVQAAQRIIIAFCTYLLKVS